MGAALTRVGAALTRVGAALTRVGAGGASRLLLGQRVAHAAQRTGEPDEGQADQRRRVAALYALKQRYAQRLCLETSGTIERFLPLDIPIDLLGREGSKITEVVSR